MFRQIIITHKSSLYNNSLKIWLISTKRTSRMKKKAQTTLLKPSLVGLSVSRILRGGGTYPTFGRWTTRKPRNEISTKPGHSPTSNSPKGFLYYLHGHGWPALLQLLKMVSHTLNTQPSMMRNHLWSEIFWPSSLWRQPGKQMKQCCDALEM